MASFELRAGRLLDGTGTAAVPAAVVHVEDGVIVYAGPAAQAPPLPSAAVLDLGADTTILPGLIDCHAHPVPHTDLAVLGRREIRDQTRMLFAAGIMRAALATGVTTFRDCGAPRQTAFALKSAIDAGLVAGPRYKAAGRMLCPTGGHGASQGGECDGADGVRRAARQLFKDGADFIKLTATGGGPPGPPRHRATFTVEEMAAAVEVAEVHDSYVTAHCHSTEGMIRCLDAGVHMLEHATFVDFDGIEKLDRAVLGRIRDQGVTVSPTVAVHGRWLDDVAARVDQMDETEHALWKRRSEGLARRLDIVAELQSAGVPVIIGSDGGFGRSYPAALDDLAYSIELHVRAGVPAADAIASATSLAADKIGMGRLVGRVTPGIQGDLIAVPGDPVADVTTLAAPMLVMQRGVVVEQRAD